MGWVLQGRLMMRAAPQWIHHGCLGGLTGLGAKGTQTYRRETARVLRITAFWAEVNEDWSRVRGFASVFDSLWGMRWGLGMGLGNAGFGGAAGRGGNGSEPRAFDG